MLKTRAIVILTALAVVSSLAVAQPAQADHDRWYLGSGFEVGGVYFNIVLAPPGYHRTGYYYRSADPFSYRHVRCTSRCFREGGYNYHHQSCPVVHRHFTHFRLDPGRVFLRYAPSAHLDRHHRHGWRGDDDRFDHRGRRHRHHRGHGPSCPPYPHHH